MGAADAQQPRVRYFRELHEIYGRSLRTFVLGGQAGATGNVSAIDRLFVVNDCDPQAMKRIIRKAEFDASQGSPNIGWADVYLAGLMLGLLLAGKEPAAL